MGDQRLRPSERLHSQREYQRVFQHGTKQVSAAFVLYVLPTVGPRARLGLAVSKRVGGAVVRNRIKRRIRAFFRQHKPQLRTPCDIVVVARRGAAQAPYAEYVRQLTMLVRHCWRSQVLGADSDTDSVESSSHSWRKQQLAVHQQE